MRRAGVADLPALAEVAQRSYRAAFAGILEDDALAGRDALFFTARFTESLAAMMVAEESGAIAGFLLATEGHIHMLFVDPVMNGRGVGSRLLAHAETHGARSLECFRDNAAARRFYERHGWRVTRAYERDYLGRVRAFVFYVKDDGQD